MQSSPVCICQQQSGFGDGYAQADIFVLQRHFMILSKKKNQ
jgi:uncharacterized protein YcsI (UPF0317 family)